MDAICVFHVKYNKGKSLWLSKIIVWWVYSISMFHSIPLYRGKWNENGM